MAASSPSTKPKAVVFDLDGCVWRPEMYELWGGGAPFTDHGDGTLRDRAGVRVWLLGAVREVLRELHCSAEWSGAVVAIASRTDEPSWAEACLQQFSIDDGRGGAFEMKEAFAAEEIYKGAKTGHFRSLARKTGIALSEMLFFDNELGNCRDVATLGVTCVHCPDGVTEDIWRLALRSYPAPKGRVVGPTHSTL